MHRIHPLRRGGVKAFITALFLLTTPLPAGEFPWSGAVPADIAATALHPDQVVDELPCNWRPVVKPIFAPLVQHCETAREAILHIAANIGATTGVYYTPQRRKHNMNALEALTEKKVSCTGQSVLLVCALRSVDIPARAVGVVTWNHVRGNHTWVEAWCDGEWHMIEFNEKDFNTPWVMENIGMLNTAHPAQRIKAANPQGSQWWIPLPFTELPNFKADDVTERYMTLARLWYEKNGLDADRQRLLVDVQKRRDSAPELQLVSRDGTVISSGKLPTISDDIRYFTRLELPRKGEYYLRLKGQQELLPVSATTAPVQIISLNY